MTADVSIPSRLARIIAPQRRQLIAALVATFAVLAPLPLLKFIEADDKILFGLIYSGYVSCVFGAYFTFSVLGIVDRRHIALRQYVNRLKDYAVSNIEPLRQSLVELKEEETESPPAELTDIPDADDTGLSTKERNTFLAIIGVLCKDSKIDYTRPAAAAAAIRHMAELQGVKIGETTIENKLKLVPDVIAQKSR